MFPTYSITNSDADLQEAVIVVRAQVSVNSSHHCKWWDFLQTSSSPLLVAPFLTVNFESSVYKEWILANFLWLWKRSRALWESSASFDQKFGRHGKSCQMEMWHLLKENIIFPDRKSRPCWIYFPWFCFFIGSNVQHQETLHFPKYWLAWCYSFIKLGHELRPQLCLPSFTYCF